MLKNLLSLVFLGLLAFLFVLVAREDGPGVSLAAEAGGRRCEHARPAAECELCDPRRARGGTFLVQEREPREGECANVLKRITLASGVAETLSLGFAEIRAVRIAEKVQAFGETMFPPAQYARVSPRITGFIREIRATHGQEVASGAVLAILESDEISRAKADWQQARALLELKAYAEQQEKSLAERKIASAREVREAEAARVEAEITLKAAASRLRHLGIGRERLAAIETSQDFSGRWELVSPIGGQIVESPAVLGELGSPERPLFVVAETDPIWLRIDVYEKDLPKIQPGRKAVFTLEALPHQKFAGRVISIGREMDDAARTGKVYAEIPNPGHLLRANMFGTVSIAVSEPEPRLLAPREAVQQDDDCDFVFVRVTPQVFRTRRVELGLERGNGVEIVSGLTEGETVVTEGSFLLKTEVLRSQIGAGCCPDD